MKKLNLTGRRFGRLRVVRENGPTNEDGRATWLCQCDCGRKKIAATDTLARGSTRSCGCLYSDAAKERKNYHGLSHSPTMLTWGAVITRCFNKRSKDFRRYGARGITACQAIRASLTGIIRVIGERPTGKTLDRRNNDGSYTCGRCAECRRRRWKNNIRWATAQQQGRNTSVNHCITISGKTRCIVEWAEVSAVKKVTILARIRRGWTGTDLILPPLASGERLH